jgi:N6-adenosine-specific RNA methylase IME4
MSEITRITEELTDLAALHGPYDLCLIDPPWFHRTWSDKGRSRAAERHYKGPPMTDDEIAALPIAQITARNSAVFLWTTMAKDHDAMHILERWGFPYSTSIPWVKTDQQGKIKLAHGHWWRNSAELLLAGKKRRGKLPRKIQDRSVPGAIIAPVREHSRKPEEAYEHIEALFGPDTKRLELFSRTDRPGWISWGNQTGTWRSGGREDHPGTGDGAR